MTTFHATTQRADVKKWEQIVFGEILIPNTLNCFGDYSTAEDVRAAAYLFAQTGYAIDIEHNQVNVLGQKAIVVESFIARAGDPDFIEGAWVVGMKILDDDLWAQVLAGDINGYSYEAVCELTEMVLPDEGSRVISGITEPDPIDGHTHPFTAIVNAYNEVEAGGTEEVDGHYHTITNHTFTGKAKGHRHRFQVIPDTHGAST